MLTPEKRLRAREKRYLTKYYVDMAYYNALGEVQGWKCAICGRPASTFKLPLVIDHKHFKVTTERNLPGNVFYDIFSERKWIASADLGGEIGKISMPGKTKAEAIEKVKKKATPYAIRGLLCPGRHGPAGTTCNRNLGRVDKQSWLRAAADYLDAPPAQKVVAKIPKL